MGNFSHLPPLFPTLRHKITQVKSLIRDWRRYACVMQNVAMRHDPRAINHLPCVFSAALQARQAACEFARQGGHAAGTRCRELRCAQPLARAACAEFDGLLREKSVFALRRRDPDAPVTGPTLTRLQSGGLEGLRVLLEPTAAAANVAALLGSALKRYGSLGTLPWEALMRVIATQRKG